MKVWQRWNVNKNKGGRDVSPLLAALSCPFNPRFPPRLTNSPHITARFYQNSLHAAANMPFTLRGLSPFFWATNVIVWLSAVIVMGILSYWFSTSSQPDWIIYMLVVVCLYPPVCRIGRQCELTNAFLGRPDSCILPRRLYPRDVFAVPPPVQPRFLVPLARRRRVCGLHVQ